MDPGNTEPQDGVGWDGEHHTAEGAAEAMAAGVCVDGQQHGRSEGGPRN